MGNVSVMPMPKKNNSKHDLTRKDCRCCHGSGEEYDNFEVGREMRELRQAAGLSISALIVKSRRRFSVGYLSDLERGLRRWNDELIADYRRICS
jgi:hypothetical protein